MLSQEKHSFWDIWDTKQTEVALLFIQEALNKSIKKDRTVSGLSTHCIEGCVIS